MKLNRTLKTRKSGTPRKGSGQYTESKKIIEMDAISLRDLEKQGLAFRCEPGVRSYLTMLGKRHDFTYKSLPAPEGKVWIIKVKTD